MPGIQLKYMKNTRKLLIIGPVPPPTHGQAVAVDAFYRKTKFANKKLINTNSTNASRYFKVLRTFKILIQIIYETTIFNYGVVYFTCSRTFSGSIKDAVLLLCLKYKSSKVVNHIHGSDFNLFFNKLPACYRHILKKLYQRVDVFVVLNEDMRDQTKDFPDSPTVVVRNFYSEDFDSVVFNKKTGLNDILYLSNIQYSKGIIHLLQAFLALKRKGRHLQLHIAGQFMPDEYYSTHEIKDLFYNHLEKITDGSVHFYGPLVGEKKVELFSKCDLFCLPSFYASEAFPISIIEAMRCGCAILVSDHRYLKTSIIPDGGVVVAKESVEAISNALEHLIIGDEINRYKKNNFNYAQGEYALSRYIDELDRLVYE